MKKTILAALFLVFAAVTANAQYADYSSPSAKPSGTFRPKFNNISFVSQHLTFDGVSSTNVMKKGIGAAYTTGRTFVLTPTPIADMLRFGIDAVWTDLNYAFHKGNTDLVKDKMHQLEFGLGVGAAIHVNPVEKLGIHAYFRFNPSVSAIYNRVSDDDPRGHIGYASFFTTGGAVSWGLISLGCEARWGSGNYKTIKGSKDTTPGKMKIKTSGLRAYVSFRF